MVTVGVPQSSVISATLFIIFINDPFRCFVSAFADDIALRYSNTTWLNIWQDFHTDLKILRTWCNGNSMVVNADKTKFVNFSLNKFYFDDVLKFHLISCNTLVNCNCPVIKQIDSIKYLGVTLDETVSWRIHVNLVHNQLKKNIRKFYFLRNLVNDSLLRSLYFALIHSRLIYGIELWGAAYDSVLKPLFISQKHFVRIISFKNKNESSLPLFRSNRILPLKYLFIFKVLKIFYIRSGNSHTDRLHYLTRSSAQGLFPRPKVNKVLFRKSFIFLGPKIYNILPDFIKRASTVKKFQYCVKNWLLGLDQVDDLLNVMI
jgi:hypothetical protein